jgi:hypothetical protein
MVGKWQSKPLFNGLANKSLGQYFQSIKATSFIRTEEMTFTKRHINGGNLWATPDKQIYKAT